MPPCAPPLLLQELCQASLTQMMGIGMGLLGSPTGAGQLYLIAPVLMDIACGMAYLHKRNIIHGGAWLYRGSMRGGGGRREAPVGGTGLACRASA